MFLESSRKRSNAASDRLIRTARYVEWLYNLLPVLKKNGKGIVCIDFIYLNVARQKDEYPMPISD